MNRFSSEHVRAVAAELRDDILGANDNEAAKVEEAAAMLFDVLADREELAQQLYNVQAAAVAMNESLNRSRTLRALESWQVTDGDALWVDWPITEPPWCGTPESAERPASHTYFLPLPDLQNVFLLPDVKRG